MMRFPRDDRGQLVLVGGVAIAFAILMIAGMSLLASEMDADRDIEPSLGPEFAHLKGEFEKAMVYRYNRTNESAEEVFAHTSGMFSVMELYYGLYLDFEVINITGTPGSEVLNYSMVLVSEDQILEQTGRIDLTR